MILKKGRFSNPVILEICRQVNREEYEQDPPTRIETENTEKQEIPNRIETQIMKT